MPCLQARPELWDGPFLVLGTGIDTTVSSVSNVSRSVSEWSESLVCGYSGIEVNSHPILNAIEVTTGGGGGAAATIKSCSCSSKAQSIPCSKLVSRIVG